MFGPTNWIFLALLAGDARVAVHGDDVCPSPARIEEELDILLGGGKVGRRVYDAHVGAVPGSVHLDFLNAAGVRLAERDLPRQGSCDERARAAAAIIATWLGIFEAEAPLEASRPAESEGNEGRTDRPAASVRSVTTAAPDRASSAQPVSFWVMVGLMAAEAGGDTVAGTEVAAIVSRRHSASGARLAFFGSTEHTLSLGPEPGAAKWRRLGLTLGPSFSAKVGGWRLELHAAVAAALLRAQGEGFPTNHTYQARDLGAAAGVRLARPWGTAAPFIGVEGLAWPGHQQILVGGVDAMARLPRVEVQLTAGLSLGNLP